MSPRYTAHPVHIRSLTSMSPRYTAHPVHIRSLTSMSPRYTAHPVHKKTGCRRLLILIITTTY